MINSFKKPHILIALALFCCHPGLFADNYDPSASVFRFQKQMATRGNAESQLKLGLMYETGSGIEPNHVKAINWYKKAAEQNYKPAINRLTYLEIKRIGFQSNHREWLKDLKNDAKFNEGEALFLLGQMYSEGTAVNKSLTRALKLLRKASGGNIPGSETEIKRVEEELAKLQQKYLTDEEKDKIIPIAILPARKSKKVNISSKIKPATIVKVKPASKVSIRDKQTKRSKTQNDSSKQNSIKQQKKATHYLQSEAKASANNTDNSEKIELKPAPHPMDTICGGRNRFSRGCR